MTRLFDDHQRSGASNCLVNPLFANSEYLVIVGALEAFQGDGRRHGGLSAPLPTVEPVYATASTYERPRDAQYMSCLEALCRRMPSYYYWMPRDLGLCRPRTLDGTRLRAWAG